MRKIKKLNEKGTFEMTNALKKTVRWIALGTLSCLVLTGCTWIALTPGGEKTQVLSPGEVSSCKQMGETRSAVQASLWIVNRNSVKVKGELEALARNEAAVLGGDTVVPTSEVVAGKQTFAVYRCLK